MKKRFFILWTSLCILICISLFAYQKFHPKATVDTVVINDGTISIEETASDNLPIEDWDALVSNDSSDSNIEQKPSFKEYDIKLMAIGDNLMHMGIVNSGKQTDGSYNYDFLFEGIKDYLASSDIRIINQETPLAGNSLGFSGYPNFNSPTEVGDAIANAGFNVVLSATNHSADQGVQGIDNIVSFWKTHPEVLLTGLHEPIEDATDPYTDIDNSKTAISSTGSEASANVSSANPRINLLTIKEVTFAILNYTYGPNYGMAPSNLAKRMDILCKIDENTRNIDFTTMNPAVLSDIEEAASLADIVIVCPHWGTEYALEPSSYQKDFALQMTSAGADVIIGTHPHVPQPIEIINADNGNTSLCYYSLGNYVSTQQNGPSMLEELAWVSFHVSENDITVDFDSSGALPLVCHYLSGPLRFGGIYALEDYTEDLALQHGIIRWGQIPFHLADLQKWNEQILGNRALKKSDCLANR